MKSICVVVNKYPNKIEPNVCVFIQQLVWSFADTGIECSVICPLPININKKYFEVDNKRIETTENGNKVTVYHPKYISLGQSGAFLQKSRVHVTTMNFIKSVDMVLKNMQMIPEILYSHFICPAGVAVAILGKKYGIPSYMAHGEATYSGNKKYGNKRLAKTLKELDGVIAVSSQNKDYLVNAKVVASENIKVFPNGYRKERFYNRDKAESRHRFGWDQDKYIVGFCGSFDDRKGVLRLQQAVDKIDEVYFVCAGKGEQQPTSNKCLWAKPVNNDELPWFYSALDLFVLPTQNEGCCNAIVEAIACGCPIISSDKSFNYDICDETNSILIDPDNVEQICQAIIDLKDHPDKQKALSDGSIDKAKKITLDERAKNIIGFLNNK